LADEKQGKKRRLRRRDKQGGVWRRVRSKLDRLEERVLLSADPLLQADRTAAPGESPIAYIQDQSSSALVTVDELARSKISIDLSKLGGGKESQQHEKLSQVSDDLIQLDAQFQAIELGLGDADSTNLVLSQEADGTLRLGGDGIVDLLFDAPSDVLSIAGGSGLDQIALDTFAVDTGDISLDLEHIVVGANAQILVVVT
jgi:hypothetical protein